MEQQENSPQGTNKMKLVLPLVIIVILIAGAVVLMKDKNDGGKVAIDGGNMKIDVKDGEVMKSDNFQLESKPGEFEGQAQVGKGAESNSASGASNAVTSGGEAKTTTTPATIVKEFIVEGFNFKFSPSEIRVKKGDTVKIVFKNTGGFHDWVVDEFSAKTKALKAPEEETITFVADKAGTFEYYCSIGSHRQMGMKGNLIVE